MTPHQHLAQPTFKRKPAAMGKKAPRAPSIVGSFSPQPWRESAGDSVAPSVCPLVLAAAQASPAAMHGDAQNGSRLATVPGVPAGVGQASPWPRFGVPALRRHVGQSD
jgi:hypothetical protein